MKFKNSILILLILIVLNISFAKKHKNNEIKAPQIYQLEVNDNYPQYIEFTLVGQFSKGFSLYFGEDKVESYTFIKGEVKIENVTSSDNKSSSDNKPSSDIITSNSPSVAPSNSPSVTPSNSPSVTPSNSPSIIPSNSPSIAPSNSQSSSNDKSNESNIEPSSTPKEKKDSKKSKDNSGETKKSSNKKLKSSHLLQKKNNKQSKHSNDSSSSVEVTQPPTVLPKDNSTTINNSTTNSNNSSSSSLESSKEITQTPNATPTSTILVQVDDRISFNITNFKSFKPVNITIHYKSNMEASVTFTFESIIQSITRVNVTGGVVDIKGRFFFGKDNINSNSPQVSIGNSSCELISYNSSIIRCYLSRGSGCDNIVSIKNTLGVFNSTKYQYCYSNPIIESVIIPSSNEKYITIIGQNFNKSPHVYLERSSKKYIQTRECKNVINGDTVIICLLNSTFIVLEHQKQQSNSKLLQTDKESVQDQDIHYSLFILNVADNITIQQAKQLQFYDNIIGEYDFNKQQQNSTILILENSQSEKVEKDNHNSNNNNNNNNSSNKSEDAKFYLLIIIPSVLFIVIVVLVAVFVKTRAKGKDKIPFLVLNDIGHTGNTQNDNQINENLITPI